MQSLWKHRDWKSKKEDTERKRHASVIPPRSNVNSAITFVGTPNAAAKGGIA